MEGLTGTSIVEDRGVEAGTLAVEGKGVEVGRAGMAGSFRVCFDFDLLDELLAGHKKYRPWASLFLHPRHVGNWGRIYLC